MSDRLRFALQNVSAAQWQLFEHLCSAFLADEYPELRTMATPSGDGGRDSQLFQPSDEMTVAIQYSVQKTWRSKIRATAKSISKSCPDVSILIYMCPHEIGAAADDLKRKVRSEQRLHVDIRDSHYFVERESQSRTTRQASETFCRVVVDPLLAKAGIIDRETSDLSSDESRAALLYLVLEREDDDMNRQLTKLCYDALVRAVLRDTNSQKRMTRSEIHVAVRSLMPSHTHDEIDRYVDRALERIAGDRKAIHHWKRSDEFCLNHDEYLRIQEGLARLALLNADLEEELRLNLDFVSSGLEVDISVVDGAELLSRVRRVLERFIFKRGEAFVDSLNSGQAMMFAGDELLDIAEQDVAKHPNSTSARHNLPQVLAETAERTLRVPGPRVLRYLRAVADGYTLFAFLRETPNVQTAVTKLFSHGELWLDTTAVLPLLAESLLEEDARGYSRLVGAAREAGVKLFISMGVLEELTRHLDVSLRAYRAGSSWHARTPFLYAAYIWSGRRPAEFPRWLDDFRGRSRPIDDLIEYLREFHQIEPQDISLLASREPEDLRWQCEEYWRSVHERRRKGAASDDEAIRQLALHDSDNFLGVLSRRHGEEVGNPFGYSTWWLTLDRQAIGASKSISEQLGRQIDSPVLSFEFLTYYLTVGPARRALSKRNEERLPLMLDESLVEAIPSELLAAAEVARRDVEGRDDRVVRRKIRDHLDREKLRPGRVGRAGLDAIREDFLHAVELGRARS